MPITKYKKTRIVPTSDYIFTAVGVFVTGIYYFTGPGRIVSMMINSTTTTTLEFTITIDGIAQTSTVQFDPANGQRQWITPDLDFFRATPAACNITWSKEFQFAANVAQSVTYQINTHAQFDVEVTI